MDNTIENQQVTLENLAWLAGIWDGEGSFHISLTNKNAYVGRVSLTNTSTEMIVEIARILDSYNIKCHLWHEGSRTPKHKPCYHLTVNKIESILRFIDLLLPYLINKKAHAKLLYRFLQSRKGHKFVVQQNPTNGKFLGRVAQGYSEEEKSLYEQLKILNKTGDRETPETIRGNSL